MPSIYKKHTTSKQWTVFTEHIYTDATKTNKGVEFVITINI